MGLVYYRAQVDGDVAHANMTWTPGPSALYATIDEGTDPGEPNTADFCLYTIDNGYATFTLDDQTPADLEGTITHFTFQFHKYGLTFPTQPGMGFELIVGGVSQGEIAVNTSGGPHTKSVKWTGLNIDVQTQWKVGPRQIKIIDRPSAPGVPGEDDWESNI